MAIDFKLQATAPLAPLDLKALQCWLTAARATSIAYPIRENAGPRPPVPFSSLATV